MPAKYATQPHWRQRRAAIGKKAGFEAEMLFESELQIEKSKPDIAPSSPVSVASMLDMPEIKPIVLPGSWTTVGKGGRPVRGEQKMYDEPKRMKRKRNRRPKQPDELDGGSMAEYEELPSSSSCLVTLSRSMLKHEKAVEAKHQAKHWVKYQREKAMKSLARDALIATLAPQDALGDDAVTEGFGVSHAVPPPKKWQLSSRNNRAERTRRKVRQAAAAARCYFEPDDAMPAEPLPMPDTKKISTSSTASPSPKSIAADSSRLDGLKAEANGVEKVEKGQKRRASGGKNCSVM